MSSGDKRLKLEFLYKLNNSVSIVRDYTIGVTNYKNLSLYNDRVSKVESMVEGSEPLKGWKEGQELKQGLLDLIESNKQSSSRLLELWDEGDKSPVEVETTATEMQNRVIDYLEKINKVTASVDLE